MAIKYIPGKVYLRDRRNGNEYEYEANLAGNSNMESFVPVPHEGKVEKLAAKTGEQIVTEQKAKTDDVPKPPAATKAAAPKAPAKH